MNDNKQMQRRSLSARRIALLATTIAGIGAVAVLAPYAPQANFLAGPAHAQNLTQQAQQLPQRPVGFADIVEKVKPAVISVRVKMERQTNSGLSNDELPFPPGSPFERFFRRFGMPNNGDGGREIVTGQGSGFFITADGYAVTNNHVVQNAETVQVTTDDGKTYAAKVIGADPRTDLALIKVDAKDFPYVKLGDNAPRVGDWVLAVGNPFGLGGTVTAGIVSARGRDIGAGPYDDFIQIDAPVNKGNSGGPTFDVEGNVIGVNTAIFSPSGGSVGIAFAIPADTVKGVVAQLRDKGSVTRGWIGVQIQPVTSDIADSLGLKKAAGALVSEPQRDSPAAKAGIESGDVIMSRGRHSGPRCPRAGAPDRHDESGHHDQAWPVPRGSGKDRDADARHAAERQAGGERADPASSCPIAMCPSSGSRWLPAARPQAPTAKACSSPRSTRTALLPITASGSAT